MKANGLSRIHILSQARANHKKVDSKAALSDAHKYSLLFIWLIKIIIIAYKKCKKFKWKNSTRPSHFLVSFADIMLRLLFIVPTVVCICNKYFLLLFPSSYHFWAPDSAALASNFLWLALASERMETLAKPLAFTGSYRISQALTIQ